MLFSLNPCKIYSFAPKEGGGRGGVCPIRHCACVALIKPPSPGARLPWAMTPCINRVIAACSHAGGVPFSSLSPFLFRYILSCLQSSFSIKNETDRDRTTVLYYFLQINVCDCSYFYAAEICVLEPTGNIRANFLVFRLLCG